MPLTFEELREEVLALPADQREELILSISEASNTEPFDLHPSWKEELKRRSDDFHSGRVTAIPWEVVEKELDEIVDGL
jgi:putative addiction module component (TIGR02574 family)